MFHAGPQGATCLADGHIGEGSLHRLVQVEVLDMGALHCENTAVHRTNFRNELASKGSIVSAPTVIIKGP